MSEPQPTEVQKSYSFKVTVHAEGRKVSEGGVPVDELDDTKDPDGS